MYWEQKWYKKQFLKTRFIGTIIHVTTVYNILGKYVHHLKKNHCPQKSTVISNFVSHHNFSIKMHAFIIYKWNSTDLQVKHFKKFPGLHNVIFPPPVALIRCKWNVFCRGTNQFLAQCSCVYGVRDAVLSTDFQILSECITTQLNTTAWPWKGCNWRFGLDFSF